MLGQRWDTLHLQRWPNIESQRWPNKVNNVGPTLGQRMRAVWVEDPKQDESPLMKRFAAAIAPSDPENDWMRAETNPYDDTSLVNIARRSRLWNMRGNGIVPYYKHRAAVNYGAKLRPRFGMRYGWTRPRGMNREYRPYRPYIKRYPPPIFGGID